MTFPPAVRPRFHVVALVDTEEARQRLTGPLRQPSSPIEGAEAGLHMELKIPKAERHFWSPNLSIELVDQDGSTLLTGLFGPRPSVWTLFATYYGALAFVAFISAIFGASQWLIDKTPWALWGMPLAAIGAIAGYVSALYGQRLARDQMERLREYLRSCFDGVEIRPVA